MPCPVCGTENPAQARFCLNCGTALAAATPRRKERKFATALFADLVGSTTLAEAGADETILVLSPITERSIRSMGEVLALLD